MNPPIKGVTMKIFLIALAALGIVVTTPYAWKQLKARKSSH